MSHLVVGTAGHIDHGKTRLIEALTGIDCDRLAEEKARGITIDLGFAHLDREDVQLSFVDVPGHERFLHNALAGLGGIRAMLLVVAADEGVKPQTREHLAVCELLGLEHAVVALTKVDLASPDQRELAELEVSELIASTRFAAAPILAVSSLTGEGIPELLASLSALANRLDGPTSQDRGARLPIDRAFHLQGQGSVVTGTLSGASVQPGDVLQLLPADREVRVRSMQVHGNAVTGAPARERVALQLAGAELDELQRGMTVATPGTLVARRRLLCRIRVLADAPAALRAGAEVRVHLLSSESLATIRPLGTDQLAPGAEGLAEIRLAEPLVAARGDRIILRRPSPAATLGGGEVLDPDWRRPRRDRASGPTMAQDGSKAAQGLTAGTPEALVYWAKSQAERGASASELAPRLGWTRAAVSRELDALAASGQLLVAQIEPRRYLAPASYIALAERARRVLGEYFSRERLARGMPKAEAVRRILPRTQGITELAETLLGWLQAQGVLAFAGDMVNLPGRGVDLSNEESALSKAVLQRFEAAGLEPPSPGEIRQALNAKPQILEGVIRFLHQRGSLVRLPGGLFLAATAFAELRRDLDASGWDRFSVAQFKERYKLTRKWAIPLLEQLDSSGTTRRIGDERQIVRRSS